MFKLEPGTIYLLKEFEDHAIFPGPSGRFNPSHIVAACGYQVMGDDTALSGRGKDTSQPFGSYTGGDLSAFGRQSSPYPHPHPPSFTASLRGQQQKVNRKTIILVTLSSPDSDKPSSSKSLTYSVVTQTQVQVDSFSCNPTAVTKLVSANVGFQVILLDSKCYPLLDNNVTSALDFWRSTRKILAASKSSYEKLTGKTFSSSTSIDLTEELEMSTKVPSPKRRCCTDENLLQKVDKVLMGIEKLEKGLEFLSALAKSFECVICKNISRKPIVTKCCQHVIGCESCVAQWLQNSNQCPHCSSSGPSVSVHVQLKGFDEVLTAASLMFEQKDYDNQDTDVTVQEQEDSDSDFELPPVNFARQP